MQPLDMADHLVNPHRGLVAKGRGNRVLAMGAAGNRHIGAAFGEISHCPERLADQPQKHLVRLPQYDQVTGLGNVLRRRSPMDPAAMRLADNPAQLPDERHDRMAGAGKTFVDAAAVEKFELRLGRDRFGRIVRNDPELGLRLR